MDSVVIDITLVALLLFTVLRHFRRIQSRELKAVAAAERGKLFSDGPRAQHPHIDATHCIGCGACTEVCPEGDVLAVIGGKAAIVNGHKCIGHGLCAEACPVGAIEIVMAPPSLSADLPVLTAEYETSLPNLFIVGELGGLALIKNAVNQGRECVDTVAARLERIPRRALPGVLDLAIVGAGPGGISASLRAIERKLSYVTLEQDELGGTVAKYPRQKLVMTSPVEFPLHGKFRKLELSKEELLQFWARVGRRADLKVNTHEKVDSIHRDSDACYTLETDRGRYRARAVILALGRRGTPRKLGVAGEGLSKVMYSLIEADAYTGKRILVVGGGDSAVEAAMGLVHQKGNVVTISYRKADFSRIKERNRERVQECIRQGRLKVLFDSQPLEIREATVELEVGGERRTLPNDYVWVFAGGTPPNEFLTRIGVALGSQDLTAAAAAEGRRVA